MGTNQNGRNQSASDEQRNISNYRPDEQRSISNYRPNDQNMRDDRDDERSMSERDRDRGRFGQDYGGRFEDLPQPVGTDDRFSGRGYDRSERGYDRGFDAQRSFGGAEIHGYNQDVGYNTDRGFRGSENRGYDSGYNQGGSGYGGTSDRGFNGDRYRNDQRFQSDRTRGNWDMDRGFERNRDFGGGYPQQTNYGGSSEQRDSGFRRSESFSSQGGGQGGYGTHLGRGRQGGFGQHGSTQAGFGQDFRGPHRGKGPQGWQRSDERIKELVCEVLSDDEHIDATNIDVVVSNGDVTLTGSVPDRHTKRLTEDTVERITGVKDVQNQLKIGADRGTTTRTTETTGSKHRA